MTGKVYLVGAGPGDPGLLTLRGKAALESADCVIYDRLANPVLLEFAPRHAPKIFVGKHGGGESMPQTEIHRMLIAHARAGEVVVRLKGGDPFLFGRGGEEAEALTEAEVPWEVIPGVSAALAVPAAAGIPVTHRDLASSMAVVTAHERKDGPGSRVRWDKLATGVDTLVVLMCAKDLARIVAQLVQHGRPATTPAAIIAWGTYDWQRVAVGTLRDIARLADEQCMGPPLTLVVGEVAALATVLKAPAADSESSLLYRLLGAEIE